ncbi:MAG: hypothetical protein IPH37_19680 [Burkholderiales bacterium]|nr:hypothetical protein [Burkholderiales bacterium]
MVLIVNADEGSAPWIALLARNHGIVFVWHLACWMTLGHVFQLLLGFVQHGPWPGRRAGGTYCVALLVSPIVFYPPTTCGCRAVRKVTSCLRSLPFKADFLAGIVYQSQTNGAGSRHSMVGEQRWCALLLQKAGVTQVAGAEVVR